MKIDLLVTNVSVYNVYLKRFIQGNAAIKDGRFLYIGARGMDTFEVAQIVDGTGKYMIPGLVDIHLHIESTMVTPQTFSHGLIQNGVTTIVSEPHEMANVFGVEGVKEMINASKGCTADILYAIPSSVPATPLETTGGEIDIADIDELLKDERVVCLGEIMNSVDVLRDPDCKTNRILHHIRTNYPNLVIEGHTPKKLVDLELARFMFAGVDSDHTEQAVDSMRDRMANGMFLEIQEKSMTPDIMDVLIHEDVAELFCFVTDDVMADTFVQDGHLNHLVKKAMAMGMKPERAIYAATYTPARRMRLYDRGAIAPNKVADFVLLSDVEQFRIASVYKHGCLAYEADTDYVQEREERQFPPHFYESVKLQKLTTEDFRVAAEAADGEYLCRVMQVLNGTTNTKELHEPVRVADGELKWQESPYGLIATFERYGKNGNRAYGFITGNTIKRGAIATTYSHDNHNLLVVGHSQADMALAANTVIADQGGFCVVDDGKVIAHIPLPVGGILSEEPFEEFGQAVKRLREAMESLGYEHYNPIMSLCTHSLPVSPALKLTDLGLIDVHAGRVVPLIVEKA
ncbi:amidohydrolase family protein [Paenibacillus alvei]|uniref:Adenine deaminase n=1 Tax=Paenibacillus alvei TaxID=44250 RepID=A0ABT4GWQ7_PAEAL|nr:adenine deaminase C-terminal domain-containing protein [Paenibacillus alvei]EJW19448.1 adenine deaminase 2 [Paenibacillus alvei DSM 29]MCY9543298.1 amidohydrolase family protein [Paenibacillus alvei]MCY9702818.1 amidohydrolase family protein [Paenibacillus alvei]MCY9736979.1 amidohydrolase family protein [Paenibacillus alvei]MCY9758404.1 amidohydrolase family protein [Paenibacillus alvei]